MHVVAPVLPGETLGGKYRVERIIGQGGMGVVVAARHIELDERVAIKFLIGEPSSTAVSRFLREARAAVKVKGEHVCRVLDFGRIETGEPYIVMEHLDGTDLAKKLAREGAQPMAQAIHWVLEVSDALAEAHDLGIVHRDIKPANVFLARRNDGSTTAKVLDFGISKLACQEKITGTQSPMGSPSYMSPEQMVSAHDVDARTDVWSLGVTLYELIAGRPPFVADSMVQMTVLVREREAPPLEGVPTRLAEVIARCMAKDPADRYASITALVADLAPFAPEEASELARRQRRRSAVDPVALAATTPAPDLASREGPSDELAPAPSTFAPLQSTVAEGRRSTPPARRRWRRAWVTAAVLAVAGLAAMRAMTITTAKDVASRTAPSAMPAAPTAMVLEAGAEPVRPSPSASTSAAIAGATPIPIPVPVPVPPPTTAARPLRPRAPIAPSATPPAGIDAAVSTASPPAAPLATATTKPAEPRKRRELDRDDP